jgi:acyl-CoA synthetase (AMP-forming)/AMP-acid ligase II
MDELADWASRQGERPALIFPDSGETVAFAALDGRANRAAQWLMAEGLAAGDCVALMLENRPEALELAWAALRAGLYYVLLNTHLKPHELAYVLQDSGARLVVTSRALAPGLPPGLRVPAVLVDDPAGYAAALARHPEPRPLPERPVGRVFMYSSGTSGYPKGVMRPLPPASMRGKPPPGYEMIDLILGGDETGVYLSPAPFYHAAPHGFSMAALARGMTVVMLRRFDPEAALAAIERHRVTHSQWVPTMFVRMLALPEAVRRRYDLSSHLRAIHAAAPCPVHVKERMIAWWGPIVVEYYGGSEAVGTTFIDAADWLAHKGSVGRPIGGVQVHILGPDGAELPPGEVGGIWFSGFPAPFEYHNAPEKTAAAYNERGYATYGDLGHLDAEGYLYLSDRRADLILSGGVNVYPAEIESVLLRHEAVADAAAIGVPDPDLGEVVQAVVQLREPDAVDAATLQAFCLEHLGRLKCPRAIDIVARLPRTEAGKLLRRELKEAYRSRAG